MCGHGAVGSEKSFATFCLETGSSVIFSFGQFEQLCEFLSKKTGFVLNFLS